ncbi:hypothetical protein ROZALSC1DRAFT_28138 [Rozella allomycis CSF55]|uniref:GDP-mannose transporter n=1 Tax=Rozella allomycis (strain CSF55) TaxID=988480 RepID=A0A075AV95_ROZAC|nr:hypothetical protein O9G_004554 [Rozella allomycis CSF55]RKP20360.1 hypothetical protein ROZALSC1DRAFT_28138 [Rozella allomycis CSF55]|eukprot:EPZ32602.1 hypothetical protein O9G_004554 [Rozella allomycis CSF55]
MKGYSMEAVAALLSYCMSSIMMTLTNKYVLSVHKFNLNFFLLGCQSLICVCLLLFCRSIGWVKFRQVERRNLIQWYPVSLMLVLMIYTGSKSIQYLKISMFTIFKNLTIILVAIGEQRMFGRSITKLMAFSFSLMVLSSIIGGYNDISFNARGFAWMMLNCLTSAGYVLYMKKKIKNVDFRDFDTVYYNNLISTPIFMFLSLMTENWNEFMQDYFGDGEYVEMKDKLAAGIILSYSTAWALRVTASTTYSMVGALNKLPVAISGMLFMKSEKEVNNGGVFSILLAFLSGLLYSYSQITLQTPKSIPLANEKR